MQPPKVLVAVDESGAASHALRWAIRNVLRPGDQLHILSVVQVLPTPVSGEGRKAPGEGGGGGCQGEGSARAGGLPG